MKNEGLSIIESINFETVSGVNSFAHKLTSKDSVLSDFVGHFSDLNQLDKQITSKSEQYSKDFRDVLVKELIAQGNNEDLSNRILNEKTFTITTGHQLNLFSGPIYSIYKVASAIELAIRAKGLHKDFDFVPVFWMATEDHDFEEINHFNLFGDKIEWKTDQKGPVGRLKLDGIQETLNHLKNKFRELPADVESLIECYKTSETLADAHRKLFYQLFGKENILILDADSKELKELFIPQILRELNGDSKIQVEKTNELLSKVGLKNQAHARTINLFYLNDSDRVRIDVENDSYFTIDKSRQWTREEIESEITSNPERFSPNVILRPLYQEVILPNLMYIGGAGELAYWAQLKGNFDDANVPFPMLQLRYSGLNMNSNSLTKWTKLRFNLSDLFSKLESLKKSYVEKHDEEIDFTEIDQELNKLYQMIQDKASSVNDSLHGYIAGEEKRAEKSLGNIKGRILKLQKQQYETQLNQIEKIKNLYFPNGILQERQQNIIEVLSKNPNYIEQLLNNMNTTKDQFNIMLS